MPMKASGQASLQEIDHFDGGVGWIAYPAEAMQRASHAVAGDGGLWVIDPVDADGLDGLLDARGDVAGVVVTLGRHERDAGEVATRYDVPVYVPEWMSGVAREIDAPIERFDREIGGFEMHRLVDNPLWQEAALFDGETLVVGDALGTVGYFLAPEERLGVHPLLRVRPPRALRTYDLERILVGHGAGIFEDATAAVREAIDGARSRAPGLYWRTIREFVG